MNYKTAAKLSPAKRAALAFAGMASLALPMVVVAGIGAPSASPQSGPTTGGNPSGPRFEVASIKPAPPLTPEQLRSPGMQLRVRLDKAQANFGGMSLSALISYAYGLSSHTSQVRSG